MNNINSLESRVAPAHKFDMRPERYAYSYASRPSKSLLARIWPFALLLFAIALLVMVRANSSVVVKLRAGLLDEITPLTSLASAPVTIAQDIVSDKNALMHAFEENKILRAENEALREWQAAAEALKAENASLRALAGYSPVEQTRYVTAKVISRSPSAYAGTLVINAGAKDGLAMLQPVIDSHGLIGRISELGEDYARVLLLSDSLSHVPVISGASRQHAILAGSGEELLRLSFVGVDADAMALGETIVTTEEGGLIPGGIVIGSVFRRDKEGFLVRPVRPLAMSEYVRVVVQDSERH